MKKVFAVLSSAMLLAGSQIHAYQGSDCCVDPCCAPGKFYAGAFAGANWLDLRHAKDLNLKTEVGFAGALSLGYAFDNGFRFEGEVGYRTNRIKGREKHHSDGYTSDYYLSSHRNRKSVYSNTWSFMANALYDFNDFTCYCPNFVPYVGFGIGYAHQKDLKHRRHIVDSSSSYNSYGDSSRHRVRKKDENGFAYQAIAGIGYQLSDATTLALEYRFFSSHRRNYDNSVGVALRQSF